MLGRSSPPRLLAITDVLTYGTERTLQAMEQVCQSARPGSVAVQLRDNLMPVASRHALGLRLREITHAHEQHLIVNDRVDLGILLAADGVHLGEHSVAARDARRCFEVRGIACWISRALHTTDMTEEPGVDAFVLAPVIASRKGRPPVGIPGLRALTQQCTQVPVYALGGVTVDTAMSCIAAGATGVAAIEAIYREPAALVRSLAIGR